MSKAPHISKAGSNKKNGPSQLPPNGSKSVDKGRHKSDASNGTATIIVGLQHQIGNQGVQRLLTQMSGVASRPAGRIQRQNHPDQQTDSASSADGVTIAKRHFDRGLASFEAHQYEKAIIHFERARQAPGLSAEIYGSVVYNIVACNLKLKRYTTAIVYLEQYLTMPGADVPLAERYLRAARRLAARDAERILTREGANIPPASDNPETERQRAQALFDQAHRIYLEGQYRQAIIIWEQVREIETYPEAPGVQRNCLYNIARANLHLHRYATAITYLEQYMKNEGARAEEVLSLLNEAREAVDASMTAEQSRFLFNLAQEAFEKSQYELAARLFEQVLTAPGLDTNARSQIHYDVGEALLRLGKFAEAAEHFRAYLQSYPNDHKAQEKLQEAERNAGHMVTGSQL